ncbi:MAG: hypothetical protein WD995_03475 [Gemmatimonadota bacterium]
MTRTGSTLGNVLLLIATLVLVAGLLYPGWRARAFDQRVESVVAGVDMIRTAAEATLDETGAWPPTSSAEAVAPGLVAPDSSVVYEWRRIESAVVPEPPSGIEATLPEMDDEFGLDPPVPSPDYFHRGAISVHSGEEALLATLLQRYPGSFVHDTVWTLLLPRVSVAPE